MSGSAKKRREKERREIRNHPERKLSAHDAEEVAKFKAFLRASVDGRHPDRAYADIYEPSAKDPS